MLAQALGGRKPREAAADYGDIDPNVTIEGRRGRLDRKDGVPCCRPPVDRQPFSLV
jgi:hypothetical protein